MLDGRREYIPTPMPREALLHPFDEDFPFESHAHSTDRAYLRSAIEARLPLDWLILSACRIDWGVPGIKPHGPDVSIFHKLRGPRKNWQTFSVRKEKVKPIAVIEIAVAETRRYDLKMKLDEYYRAGVPLYAIVNTRERRDVREIQIIGYRSGPTRYKKMELDNRGRLLLEPLGLLLGAQNEHVRLWDASTGKRIPTHKELVRENEAIRRRTRQIRKQIKWLRCEA
jgi:Uma2 family endonuclease